MNNITREPDTQVLFGYCVLHVREEKHSAFYLTNVLVIKRKWRRTTCRRWWPGFRHSNGTSVRRHREICTGSIRKSGNVSFSWLAVLSFNRILASIIAEIIGRQIVYGCKARHHVKKIVEKRWEEQKREKEVCYWNTQSDNRWSAWKAPSGIIRQRQ